MSATVTISGQSPTISSRAKSSRTRIGNGEGGDHADGTTQNCTPRCRMGS
jgi:hypothetical protein